MSWEEIFESHFSTQMHAKFTPEFVNRDQLITVLDFISHVEVMSLCILFRRIQLLLMWNLKTLTLNAIFYSFLISAIC
jgi:hypothetical protein